MWEAIRANRRRSTVLIILLGFLLLALGSSIGGLIDPSAAPLGALVALVIWVILLLAAFAGGEGMLLAQAGAREVSHDDAPQLFNIVEEMKIASGLSFMPKVYIIDDPSPNAFAVGLNERRAAVAVTTGLLARLNRDELQGVVAHEIGHIANRDTQFMTLAGVTMGAVVMIADLYLRGLRYGGFRGRSSSKNSGQAAALMAILALVLALVAPLLAQLLYFACSRKREYLADASAVQFTRYPEGLASALERIADSHQVRADASRVLAPMYFINPFQAARGGLGGLFSTHPPLEDRVRILRGIANDTSLAAYEAAYRLEHKNHRLMKNAGAAPGAPQPARNEGLAGTLANPAGQWRESKDMLHKLNHMVVIPCACGLKMKFPPNAGLTTAQCPRCGATHKIQPQGGIRAGS